MRDFPSCFGENGVQIADSSSSSSTRTAQNMVTCVYQSRLCVSSCVITITWSKNLMGQGLSVGIDDSKVQSLCKLDIRPSIFSKKKGSKCVEAESCKVEIYWDLSSAKFGSGPEPLEGFYLAIVVDQEMILLLGDMCKEAMKKANTNPPIEAILLSRKEHIFGKNRFSTRAQFCNNGHIRDIAIECQMGGQKEPCLLIRVDKKTVLQVKHLTWKFRGNQTIFVDGQSVELFWDVHNWLFGPTGGSAVFMFQTRVVVEKLWPIHSSGPSLPWSCSEIFRNFRDTQTQRLDFSLILYAWKND